MAHAPTIPQSGHGAHHEGFVMHGAWKWWHYLTFNTDHKVIGIQYLVTTFFFFLFGGALALMVRTELMPGIDFLNGTQYNRTFTMHASMMIFLFVIPVFAGFANYIIPLQIGAEDMAFPKLNAVSYWMLLIGSIMLVSSYLWGAPEAGWTAYPPLSLQGAGGQTMWALAVIVLGFSSIFGAINFLVTVTRMRAPGMGWFQLPLFTWAMISTAIIQVLATPVLATGLFLLALERMLGANFFNVSQGGDLLMWQHVFWFYSHPAVYVMVLPAMGIVSDVLPVFSRKPIFGYKAIAFASLAICFLGFTVWAHHMFTSGMNPLTTIPFMITSMIIAVPTGIKIFSWMGTMWFGKLRFSSAMLFAIGFVSLFVIGGLSGVMLASIPVDIHVHDSYFVVAHLHFVLFGGSVSAIYAGFYYWFPKITGRLMNERWGKVHFWLNYIGFLLTFMIMHLSGLQGMPRRVVEYAPEFATYNAIATIGAFLLGISTIPFLINVFISLRRGEVAGDNPWEAKTLEWQTSSPPSIYNWDEDHQPHVSGGPYDFGFDGAHGAAPAMATVSGPEA